MQSRSAPHGGGGLSPEDARLLAACNSVLRTDERWQAWLIANEALFGERASEQKHLAVTVEVVAYLLSRVMVEFSARCAAEGGDPNSMVGNLLTYVSLRAREIITDAAQPRH